MLKERLGNDAPIRIMDIDEVFMAQAKTVSNYEGLAIPIRNAKMVFGNTDVKRTLRNIYGDRVDPVMKNLIQDLEESRIVDKSDFGKMTDTVIRGARQAILGANPKVVLNQVASLPNAMSEVDFKYFVGINPMNLPKNELLEKYSPELWWRNKGYVTREVGDITSRSGDTIWTAGIKKSDNATIRTIWAAVEKEKLATTNLKQGTDEFYTSVARRVEEVVHRTQPNWDALYRSDIARTKDQLEKLATMFTTQRNQNYNMIYEGYRKYLNSGNASDLLRPVSTVIAGSLAIGGIDYGAKQILGRETEENYYRNSVVNSFVSNSYIGTFITQNLIKEYDVNNVLESSINPIFRAVRDLPLIFEEPGKVVHENIKALSTVFGIPVNNIEKWLMPVVKQVNLDAYLDYQMNLGNYQRTDLYSDFYSELAKPNEDRDLDKLETYINKLRKDGATAEGLKSSISYRMSNDEEGIIPEDRVIEYWLDRLKNPSDKKSSNTSSINSNSGVDFSKFKFD
jgi:hypothetical protein